MDSSQTIQSNQSHAAPPPTISRLAARRYMGPQPLRSYPPQPFGYVSPYAALNPYIAAPPTRPAPRLPVHLAPGRSLSSNTILLRRPICKRNRSSIVGMLEDTFAERDNAAGDDLDLNKMADAEIKTTAAPCLTEPLTMCTINIGHGPNSTTYLIHLEIASHYSPVLKAAFNGQFLESQTKAIDLDDIEHPVIFGYIQAWMYSRQLVLYPTSNNESAHLYQLWLLADRLLIPRLQNLIIERILTCEHFPDNAEELAWIFHNAGEESKLGRLFLDRAADMINEDNVEELPKEMLAAMLTTWKRKHKALDEKLQQTNRWCESLYGINVCEVQKEDLKTLVEKYSVSVSERGER